MKSKTLSKIAQFLSILSLGTAPLSMAQSKVVPGVTLKLGVVEPMSGNTATFGEETMKGVRMAVDEINALPGLKIQLTLEDDKSSAIDAASAIQKLINVDKVNIVLGSVASSNTNAMAPIAQKAKIPLLTSASTNVNVTQKGEYISRICFIDDFQGDAMAKFALDTLKAKKAAIVIDTASDYSQGLAKAFRDSFKAKGGEVVVEVNYTAKDQDFSSQLTKIRTKRPDVIFVPGYYAEVGAMIRQAKSLGLRAPFLGGDGWSSPDLYKTAGEAIIGHFYADHFSSDDVDPRVQDFVKKYRTKFKEDPAAMTALGYDAVLVIADAVRRNGNKVDSLGLMKAINSTKEFRGVTGVITLDANRNARKSLVILETQRDKAIFKARVAP